jgi:hypothetical protein
VVFTRVGARGHRGRIPLLRLACVAHIHGLFLAIPIAFISSAMNLVNSTCWHRRRALSPAGSAVDC